MRAGAYCGQGIRKQGTIKRTRTRARTHRLDVCRGSQDEEARAFGAPFYHVVQHTVHPPQLAQHLVGSRLEPFHALIKQQPGHHAASTASSDEGPKNQAPIATYVGTIGDCKL